MTITRTELLFAATITVAGFALRFAHLDELAVEHFDEGVYASNLLFPDADIPFQYPERFLYAPPLHPQMVEWSILIFGDADWVPFLPSLIFGSLTVPLVWWVARRWFRGGPCGVSSMSLVAFNEFHITMSRSVLTDVPLLFYLLLSVWLISEALARVDYRIALAAGLSAGAAWATKYNGWLSIAIAVSGSAGSILATFRTRQVESIRLRDSTAVLAVTSAVSLLVWLLAWNGLQDVGGYARVSENHQQYVVGVGGWIDGVIRHEAVQRHYAGTLTFISALVAVASGAMIFRAERFTWNATAPDSGSTWNGKRFRGAIVMAGVLTGALVLSPLVVLAIWTLTEFITFALSMRKTMQLEGESKFDRCQWFGVWLCLAWFVGLLVATPLYQPYPRLLLPWLCICWIGTGAAADRLLFVLFAGKTDRAEPQPALWSHHRIVLVVALALLCIWRVSSNEGNAWQQRSELTEIAERVISDARAATRESDVAGSRIDFVLYVYGEPGLFFHLPRAGVPVQPISDLNFAKPGSGHARVPTFMLAGPHAQRSENFEMQFNEVRDSLELVGVYPYRPSDFVLLDDHAPSELDDHRAESVRMYRVQFR